MNKSSLTPTEKTIYALRSLYESYGYSQYKMSKFEEYDLYVRNKSFLLSDNIIAFTDTTGKLMALKPDVTLSIVKNSGERENGVRRVYYNENVYRVPRGGFAFKEIMQSGLECIGEIDDYNVSEVLLLAAKSLSEISESFVLDISDLGIVSSIIDSMGVGDEAKEKIITAIGEKNAQGIDAVCAECSADKEKTEMLKSLVSMNGGCDEMLKILEGSDSYAQAKRFATIVNVLKASFGDKVRIDFSVVDDMRYYTGIVFKGFVKGIPTSVLSGGRYDKLMERMGKRSGAIGFAVYLDLLDMLDMEDVEYDADVFVQYSENTPLDVTVKAVDELISCGRRVISGRVMPEKLKVREIVKI